MLFLQAIPILQGLHTDCSPIRAGHALISRDDLKECTWQHAKLVSTEVFVVRRALLNICSGTSDTDVTTGNLS